jgi:hypothetical protein
MKLFTDKSRAKYLLEARANGGYRLTCFIRFNKIRYLVLGLYVPVALVYFVLWGSLLGLFGFVGLTLGWLITDLSWVRGQNKKWDFTARTTNWAEVERIANE